MEKRQVVLKGCPRSNKLFGQPQYHSRPLLVNALAVSTAASIMRPATRGRISLMRLYPGFDPRALAARFEFSQHSKKRGKNPSINARDKPKRLCLRNNNNSGAERTFLISVIVVTAKKSDAARKQTRILIVICRPLFNLVKLIPQPESSALNTVNTKSISINGREPEKRSRIAMPLMTAQKMTNTAAAAEYNVPKKGAADTTIRKISLIPAGQRWSAVVLER
jgi:hypothetical protein